MQHDLTIKQRYLIRLLTGEKKVEIRLNDRDFQVMDTIRFLPLEGGGYNVCDYLNEARGLGACVPKFNITYVHSGLGMAEGWVALSVEEVPE